MTEPEAGLDEAAAASRRGPPETACIPPPPEHAGPVLQPPPMARAAAGGSPRDVAVLAGPAVVSLLSVTLMWTADTFFIGRVGTAEQGGVGFAGTVAWTVLVFFVGVLNAVQIFVAQHVGARSPRGAGEMTWQGIHLGLAAAVPIMLLSSFAEPLIAALRVDPAIAPHAAVYLRIRLLGAAGVFVANACENYLRGVGDTRSPMVVTLAANGVNILLDYLLIFGHWGLPRLLVAGAAWATIASGFLQGAALFILFERRGRREGHCVRAIEPPRREPLGRLLRVGLPIGFQWLLDMGSWTVFTAVIAQLGAVQAAAHQVAISVLHFSFMPGYGISIAATTLVGQYLGAGDRAAALRTARSALLLALLFMGAMGIVFLVFRHAFIAAFNPDPDVIALGGRLLLFAALFQLFDATNMVLSGVLRGAGDTRYPMVATIILSWALFVPLAWLLTLRLGQGAAGGWLAAVIWLAALALVLRHRYASRRWLERELVVEGRALDGAGSGRP